VLLDGWQVVTDRDANFKPGELVVFCQSDTFLPEVTFSKVHNLLGLKVADYKNERGYNLVTRIVSRQLSQGLVFHLASFPDIKADVEKNGGPMMQVCEASDLKDYAGLLGVKSWVLKGGKMPVPCWLRRGCIPSLEIMTSVDNMPMLQQAAYQETFLMDGNQMTCYFVRKESRVFNSVSDLFKLDPHSMSESGCFGVCGPDRVLPFRPSDMYWQVALHYDLKEKLAALDKSVAVTGELVGSNIKGNPYGYTKGEHEFLVYDVIDIDTLQRWNPKTVESFAMSNVLEHVPVRGYHVISRIARHNEDLLVRANLQADHKGLVFKNVETGKWFKVESKLYFRRLWS
jgi:RNA ligase (TIGR02306 family)